MIPDDFYEIYRASFTPYAEFRTGECSRRRHSSPQVKESRVKP